MNTRMMEKAMEVFLTSVYGLNWETDPNLKDTPERMRKMYESFLSSSSPALLDIQLQEICKRSFPANYEGSIFAPRIKSTSLCPHHFLPVMYNVTIGYIVGEKKLAIGASKLERVARTVAKQAMLQEDYTTALADVLDAYLKPAGVAIVVSGKHGCMMCRGIKTESPFVTSILRGSYIDNEPTRSEFFSLLQIEMLRK